MDRGGQRGGLTTASPDRPSGKLPTGWNFDDTPRSRTFQQPVAPAAVGLRTESIVTTCVVSLAYSIVLARRCKWVDSPADRVDLLAEAQQGRAWLPHR